MLNKLNKVAEVGYSIDNKLNIKTINKSCKVIISNHQTY